LNCHVEGTLRPATVVYRTVNSTVIDREDFARIAYETLQDGVEPSNLKYREMFFNPTLHTARGIPMATVIDGLIEGAKAAETDFGVRCALIADVYRQDPPPVARPMVEEVLAHRGPELIGLGVDAAEAPDPPEKFVEAYRVAKAAGLRLTSHCAEDGPAANVTTCLDLIGCERLDHGYHILEDPAVVARCRDEGVTFTVCPSSTAVVYGWPNLTTHPITKMIDAGLRVMLTRMARPCSTPTSASSTPSSAARTTPARSWCRSGLAGRHRQGGHAAGIRNGDRRARPGVSLLRRRTIHRRPS
jgi:adenosine deaminase